MRTLFPIFLLLSLPAFADAPPGDDIAGCYRPIEGGFTIYLPADPNAPHLAPDSHIGVVDRNASYGEGHSFFLPGGDNPRLHRRPLYPPADKSLVWNDDERAKFPQCGFRPLVLAYNEPRFLFDFHAAGGLLGHLQAGLTLSNGVSKWFHQWADLRIAYTEGRMEYTLADPDFPGVTVRIVAGALAESDGLVLTIAVTGAGEGASLVWAYGGASAFFTNYAMTDPHFTFAPEQCAKDDIELKTIGFSLVRGFDKSDSVMEQVFAAPRFLPGWKAVVKGGSLPRGTSGLGDPAKFTAAPADLAASMDTNEKQKTNCVAVQQIPLKNDSEPVFIVVGMGGNIAEAIRKPQAAFDAMLERNKEIASRVVVTTPDPYLNAAVTMMAFATDGTWGDTTVMHGGWSWRFGYLGWRGWYGSVCYGWTDRIRTAIENQTTLGLIAGGEDAGALSSLLDTPGGVFYNMNEVFLDHVRQYFEYTNDVELMRKIWPVLTGIVEWESRRLQPGDAHLYENALNTWISDSHWYIQGQCTQASAYMLGANRFLADLATHLGEDPSPWRERAESIRTAMQEKLWLDPQGVFAEYVDTRGEKLVHTQPELPTIYHSIEFGAADPAQIHRMLEWVSMNLKSVTTPNGGKMYWSSNWYPNNGRSYTHSTYELAYAEELNLATAMYADGFPEAYRIIEAALCGIFNGPTPGGLSCHAYVDGRQRANDEFADAISMWGRAVVEGMFGIVPKLPDGYIQVSPQFDESWNGQDVSIKTPMFSYGWKAAPGSRVLEWETKKDVSVHLKLPVRAGKIHSAKSDGNDILFTVTPGFNGLSWVSLETPKAQRGHIEVLFEESAATPLETVPKAPETAPKVWTAPDAGTHDLAQWTPINLDGVFNSTIIEALEKVYNEATPPPDGASRVGFDYWRSHLSPVHHGERVQMPSDAAWRAKVDENGVAWTRDGIPFKTVKDGPNIGIVSQAGGFPKELSFPVNASGKTLYLMLSGMSFPVQSHTVHLRLTLRYAATSQTIELTSPEDIGDCWSTWCNRWHDTAANGFENLGGRSGPAGSADVPNMTQPVAVDTEAHLVAIPMREGEELKEVNIAAVANDVVFGVMGASVLK